MSKLPHHFRALPVDQPEPNGSWPCTIEVDARAMLILVLDCPCLPDVPKSTRTVYVTNPEDSREHPEGIPAHYWDGVCPVPGRLFRIDEGYLFAEE